MFSRALLFWLFEAPSALIAEEPLQHQSPCCASTHYLTESIAGLSGITYTKAVCFTTWKVASLRLCLAGDGDF